MPDWLAERCSTTSKYSGTKIVIPTSVPMLQAPASVAQRTTGLPSTVSGKNGSFVDTSRQANSPHRSAEVEQQRADLRRDPFVSPPAPRQREQQRDRRRHHQQRADHIELVLARMKRHAAQHARGHAERHQAERQIDPENQRPVDMFSQKAAEHRPAHRGGGEHRADIALVAAALARGNNVGDDGLRERHQPAAAEALEGARQDQFGHARAPARRPPSPRQKCRWR